jgi:propanol-preferring alcohol dehydrogenase
MMRAAVLDGPGQPLRLATLPVPAPGDGEVLVRLEASGICHSDVHVWKGEMRPAHAPDPFILGHEGVGRVAALGPGVTGWAVGERIGVPWLHDTCGTCAECRAGAESFCQNQRAHGFDVPGTFADHVVVKADFAVRLPEGPAPALAPLLCAGLTAYGALERANLKAGETCAIIGCGGLGLYAVQLAARRGARVLAVDTDPGKLDLARQMGAASVVTPDHLPASAQAEVTVNFAPTTATWPSMIALTRPLGRIVAAAMVADPVPLRQEWLAATGVTLTGTSVGTRKQMLSLVQLHAERPLGSEVVEIPLDEASAALAALAGGRARGRYCIRF